MRIRLLCLFSTLVAQTLPVPDAGDCVDIVDGAELTNSWSCRSCLQFHVDFVATIEEAASIGGISNGFLEIWFTSGVTASSSNWYPVVATQPASAVNGIKFIFDQNNQWPNNHIQLDGMVRQVGMEIPELSAIRLCPMKVGSFLVTSENLFSVLDCYGVSWGIFDNSF